MLQPGVVVRRGPPRGTSAPRGVTCPGERCSAAGSRAGRVGVAAASTFAGLAAAVGGRGGNTARGSVHRGTSQCAQVRAPSRRLSLGRDRSALLCQLLQARHLCLGVAGVVHGPHAVSLQGRALCSHSLPARRCAGPPLDAAGCQREGKHPPQQPCTPQPRCPAGALPPRCPNHPSASQRGAGVGGQHSRTLASASMRARNSTLMSLARWFSAPSIIATSMPAAWSVAMPAAATSGLGSPAPTTTWAQGGGGHQGRGAGGAVCRQDSAGWLPGTRAQAGTRAASGRRGRGGSWQAGHGGPCMVARTGAHPRDARLDQRLAAGWCAPIVVARLKRHVRGRAARGLACACAGWGQEGGGEGGANGARRHRRRHGAPPTRCGSQSQQASVWCQGVCTHGRAVPAPRSANTSAWGWPAFGW